MPTEGRNSQTDLPVPTRRTKLSPLDRYQRGRQIAAMRAREVDGKPRPVSWKDIAKAVNLSESGAKDAYSQFLTWELPQHDPLKVVDETIDVMTVAMHEALETYAQAKPGSSVRVQALKTAVETAATRLQIMRAAGRAPRSLAGPSVAAELQLAFREFAELLSRHDVGDDVLRDFLGLAESRMGRLTAVEGHAIPA